jgi:hypothetical protein
LTIILKNPFLFKNIMPLSEREIQAITYEISDRVNNIPVKLPTDIPVITNELNSIFDASQSLTSNVPEEIQSRIQSIRAFLDPEFEAVRPDDQPEFVELAQRIIRNKIDIFSRMNSEQEDLLQE